MHTESKSYLDIYQNQINTNFQSISDNFLLSFRFIDWNLNISFLILLLNTAMVFVQVFFSRRMPP